MRKQSTGPFRKAGRHGIFRKLGEDTIVWKSARTADGPCIIKLLLRKGTIIYENDGDSRERRKCRAAAAHVLEILEYVASRRGFVRKVSEARSRHRPDFLYRLGKAVKPKTNFSMKFESCASGIHYFYNRNDAARWGI